MIHDSLLIMQELGKFNFKINFIPIRLVKHMSFNINELKHQIKTTKDYHYLHLKCDVLLLVDVFGKFRNNSLKNYGLCPSHYLSAPALSWDALLNTTKAELELTSYTDMYLFFEKGTRGGVSYISKRSSKVNNKH